MKALVVVFVLLASPALAQQSIVSDVKTELQAKGVSLSGSCGAFEIVKRVVWKLRGQGFGFVADSGDTSCLGFSSDIVQSNQQGVWVDILQDEGGLNSPRWDAHVGVTPEMWRAPIDPGDAPVVQPLPSAPVFTFDYGLIRAWLETYAEQERQRDERMFEQDGAKDARINQKLDALAEKKDESGIGNPMKSRTFWELAAAGVVTAILAERERNK